MKKNYKIIRLSKGKGKKLSKKETLKFIKNFGFDLGPTDAVKLVREMRGY